MASIGSSSSFQSALLQLSKTSQKISDTSSKLASGKKITSPKEDPTALSSITQMDAALRGLDAAQQNIDTTNGLLNTAQGGLEQTVSSLQQLRELAVQAADGTLSGSDRAQLTAQASTLVEGINSTAQNLDFGGTALLDGSFSNKTLQVGPSEGDSIPLSLAGASSSALGVNSLDLSTTAGAQSALSAIDEAIASAVSQQGQIGATQNRLDSISNANTSTALSLTQAKSEKEDLDASKAVAQMVQLKIQRESQLKVLTQSVTSEQGKISLLV